MAIPAWVIYALKIAGAASGNKNMQALGGALGETRTGQLEGEQMEGMTELFSSEQTPQEVKGNVLTSEKLIEAALSGRGEMKIGSDGKMTFSSDKTLLQPLKAEVSPTPQTAPTSNVVGAESLLQGGGLDEATKSKITSLFQ